MKLKEWPGIRYKTEHILGNAFQNELIKNLKNNAEKFTF